jgi:hypothetical protein
MGALRLLSGEQRTSGKRAKIDVNDPTETLASEFAMARNAVFPLTA